MNLSSKSIILIILGTLFIILCICAFYIGLVVRTYKISTKKITSGNMVKILHITDLHGCIYGKNQKNLLKKIKEISPDIICMTGDIADDKKAIDGTLAMLDGIQGYPCFYVIGNHETRRDSLKETVKLFEDYGVTVLSELSGQLLTTIEINGQKLMIAGIDDPMYKSLEKTKKQLSLINRMIFRNSESENERKNFTILLSHRPELTEEYAKTSFDLVLSGHAHGGQWRIPYLINGVLAPHQGLFPKYAGGVYSLSDAVTLIVGRGLALNNLVPRIFNPPELSVIEISGEN